jgi:murein DD-endopeptidase MepM/ murein hydrolase activator NlpD
VHPRLSEARRILTMPSRRWLPAAATRVAQAGRARLAKFPWRERLVPIGLCVLVAASILLSALPTVGASGKGDGAAYHAQYGMGLDDQIDQSGDALPLDNDGLSTYPPELVIVNALQNPPATTAPRTEFVWYVVKNGDSVRAVAARYGLRLETLYNANKKSLPDPESIKAGLRLLIPPTDGLVVTVKDGDTVMTLANKYGVSGTSILDANMLPNAILTVGQMLVIPVEPGDMPGSAGGTRYAGGSMWWPVVGGKNYISQYFNSGHRALDIAAKYGTPVIAAAGGTVVYAGWRSKSQGGYVVWIKHTDGLYTTYNHLSKWYVRSGQEVSAGRKIGLIGTSGVSTGPHLHFEVWLGYPWGLGNNSDATNPCRYLAAC